MKTALRSAFQFLFGCYHHQLSRVFTIRRHTYEVCVVCGREFECSWELMHRQRRTVADNAYAPLTTARQAGASTI